MLDRVIGEPALRARLAEIAPDALRELARIASGEHRRGDQHVLSGIRTVLEWGYARPSAGAEDQQPIEIRIVGVTPGQVPGVAMATASVSGGLGPPIDAVCLPSVAEPEPERTVQARGPTIRKRAALAAPTPPPGDQAPPGGEPGNEGEGGPQAFPSPPE